MTVEICTGIEVIQMDNKHLRSSVASHALPNSYINEQSSWGNSNVWGLNSYDFSLFTLYFINDRIKI